MLIQAERVPNPPERERRTAIPCTTYNPAGNDTSTNHEHSRRLIRLDPTDAHMSIATSMQTESTRADEGRQGDPPRSAGLDLPASPQSAGAARRFATAVLADWRLADLADDVDLVISELITNALLHARADQRASAGAGIRLDLEYDGKALTCRVLDGSPLPPTPEQAGDTAESGRGLLLVDALSAEWGWSREASGKVVWARFHTQ